VTANLVESDAARLAVAQLEALSVAPAEYGFLTCVLHDSGMPSLRVVNRDSPGSRENITVGPAENGVRWFCWSWGDRIALVGDVATAAFKIAYVLTPQAGVAG